MHSTNSGQFMSSSQPRKIRLTIQLQPLVSPSPCSRAYVFPKRKHGHQKPRQQVSMGEKQSQKPNNHLFPYLEPWLCDLRFMSLPIGDGPVFSAGYIGWAGGYGAGCWSIVAIVYILLKDKRLVGLNECLGEEYRLERA